MSETDEKSRSLALTPSWSVACVLTMFVAVSLLVERSIHRLSSWLKESNRKPLFEALEKMKEELMLLGFISLLLTATSSTISSVCISSRFYDGRFTPCTKSEVEDDAQKNQRLLMGSVSHHSIRRLLATLDQNTCKEGHEPFVSYEGLEQLHRFIFVMAITHISYSCLTMLLAIVKIHTWRNWENEAHMERRNSFDGFTREGTVRRQSMFVKFHMSNPLARNTFLVWVTCFIRQFCRSVDRADYHTLRMGFIMNHNLASTFDFHSYMVRSMEEEFPRVVGVSPPLWGFVVAFMLFNVNGSNLYLWIAIIPITLVLVVGAKLQHIMATLAWENAGITGFFTGTKLKPRDDLFWFRKPKILLSLIHFVLFQNAFELASFFWFWWQFGYESCFISNHLFVYIRLIVGFVAQFLCSYSTLPLYALITQMGTNYKAALIPQRIRETIHHWKKAAKKKRRRAAANDDSTIHTYIDTSTVLSVEEEGYQQRSPTTGAYNEIEIAPTSVPNNNIATTLSGRPLWTYISVSPDNSSRDEDEHQFYGIAATDTYTDIELQPTSIISINPTVARGSKSSSATRSTQSSSSHSSPHSLELEQGTSRSSSMPFRRS